VFAELIGTTAGSRSEIDFRRLMSTRGSIHAATLRARPLEAKAQAVRAAESHAVPLLAGGRIHVPVFARFPLRDAIEAYEAFATPGKFGKIVLEPQS
jgi:NADPH:quinone reductase-like Zn-dependent oxidoreductase